MSTSADLAGRSRLRRHRPPGVGGVRAVVGALGVVYGDIGTSPLYVMQSVFANAGGVVSPTRSDVFGVISLIFWSIMLIVSIKYVTFVLRADNDGEGGVMALMALARGKLRPLSRGAATVTVLGALGAALFFGDSVITPAISVLSAVEGLDVFAPELSSLVVPIVVAILTALFAVQRWGTDRVGAVFGPVMLLWFVALGAVGLRSVVSSPGIVGALSPTHGLAFVVDRPYAAFVALGAVVLAITGAEALYADLGQFGRAPIRWAWFLVVFPALTLNYLGQGALVLGDPQARANPFYLLVPPWARLPMVVVATLATIIASEAVLSGAFSMARQAAQLDLLPRLRLRHTSPRTVGQIYVPAVNGMLFVVVLVVAISFGSSMRLANAYGVAVTGTFLITTALFLTVARTCWRWATWQLVGVGAVLGSVEIAYFVANLSKVVSGGWLTLLIAATVLTVMLTWRRGHAVLRARRAEREGPLSGFVTAMRAARVQRVPGCAVYPHATDKTVPLALRATLERMHVLHEQVVIMTERTADVPHVLPQRQVDIRTLGDPGERVTHLVVDFGFQDVTDYPEVLQRAGVGQDGAWFFVSRPTLHAERSPLMDRWQARLFVALAHRAGSTAESLHLPPDRTIVMGSEVDL